MVVRHDAPGYRAALVFMIITVAGYLLLSGVFLLLAPDRVPSHFNAAGVVDRWSSKTAVAAGMLPVGTVLPILMGLPWPWANRPGLLNLPYKDDWIRTGRQRGLTDRVVVFMRLVAGLLALLASVILLVMFVDTNADQHTETAPGWVLAAGIGIFLVGIGLCLWKIFRDLKPDW